ncbi:MAG: hypothetical protein ABIR06_07505 [Cyclobacteriaceae bacterium]
MKLVFLAIFFVALFFAFVSCDKTSKGSSDNKKTDSLFLGISLGMERNAFYDYCWEQNKKKFFTHGPTNQNVEYNLVNVLAEPVSMRFYPSFHKDKIFEMPVTFAYESWAPWNERFGADSLLTNLLPVFKKWYGDDFKELQHPTMGVIYYKIDGKRRINLFKKDDQFVQAVFTDLKVEKHLKEEYARKLKTDQ